MFGTNVIGFSDKPGSEHKLRGLYATASGKPQLLSYPTACNYSYMQLMDFNARFYSPTLGRFIQPDSIVPDMTNNQAWNRYSYSYNNPLNYTDPSGHRPSGPEHDPLIDDLYSTEQFYKDYLSYYYDWNLKGNWTLDELKLAHQVAKDIEEYIDGITDHKGRDWMYEYMGDISIAITSKDAGSGTPGKIKLPSWWNGGSKYHKYYLAHELAHIWDINTGHIGILGAVDGPADHLNDFINVLANEDKGVFGKWANRFGSGTGKKHIPSEYLFKEGVMMNGTDPYGNKSTVDYLAESFALNIYYPERGYVHPHVTIFVNAYISVQASSLP